VHGSLVRRVTEPPGAVDDAGSHDAAERAVPPDAVPVVEADALVTDVPGVVLAVFTADCAPIAFASAEGVIGLAHAGWLGAAAGVVHETVAAMREMGASSIVAALGPCIRPECYEFGVADLDRMVARFGPSVRGRTRDGAPALDLPETIRVALAADGVTLECEHGACTACDAADTYRWFSHRARKEPERQATLVWLEP